MSDNYYVDTLDGEGDALICGACVKQHGLQDTAPVDPEVFRWAPLSCAVHVYGGSPDDYMKKTSEPPA